MDANLALEMNGGDDEEEALRRAIAMSMGSAEIQYPGDPGVRDDASGAGGIVDLTSSPPAKPALSPVAPTAPPPTASSMLGLDRKKMEEERLARLKKRKAPEAEEAEEEAAQQPTDRAKRARPTPSGIVPPHLRQAMAGFRENQSAGAYTAARASGNELPFPRGVVKKTWAAGQPRSGDDIKIEEVLQADDLELAVLSSFVWDEEWLLSKLNLQKTKVVLVAFADSETQKEEMRSNAPGGSVRFCFPRMMGYGSMHSKLQLLKYPTYLRVVVPTGNLEPHDWGARGIIENMVFLIDLPRIEDRNKRAANQLTGFGEDLCYFLRAQGLDESLVASLRGFDFSETKRMGFVHTIAGSHLGDTWKRTGYCGLGRAVASLGWQSDDSVEVDFLTASVGALNADLLTALYNACQGDSGKKEYGQRTQKPKGKGKGKAPTTAPDSAFEGHFRVYFPAEDTVTRSRGGKNGAGTICFQSRYWDAPSLPREVFRDFENVRTGLLSHSKMMFVRRPAPQPDHLPGWAYVGSANLSESAWGRLVKDRATGEAKLTCRNWECGVVLPAALLPPSQQEGAQPVAEGPGMLDMFRNTVPVPMELPGCRYDQSRPSKQPWFFLGREA